MKKHSAVAMIAIGLFGTLLLFTNMESCNFSCQIKSVFDSQVVGSRKIEIPVSRPGLIKLGVRVLA